MNNYNKLLIILLYRYTQEFWGKLVDSIVLSKRGINKCEEFHRTELYLPITGVCFTLSERCNTALNGEAAAKENSVALQSDQLICPGIKVFVQRSSQSLATQLRRLFVAPLVVSSLHCPAISSIFKSTFFLSCHLSPSPSSSPPPANLMFSHFLFPHPLHFFHHSPCFLPHSFS